MNRNLKRALAEAERKAWNSLSGYKFLMFGYHAAQWVTLNKLNPKDKKQPNPFRGLVKYARANRPS